MEAAKEICIGFDVGKSAHRACAISRKTGEVLFNKALDNRERSIDEVLRLVDRDALVVVDQKRNIGALVLERARVANMDVAYLPGLAMKRARDMFPGIAKTDEIDAEVIARTGIGMPWTLRPIAEETERGIEIRLLAAQRRFLTKCATQSKNRLRSVLLEVDPAFEACVDLGLDWHVAVFGKFGGAVGITSAGRRRYRRLAVKELGAPPATADGLWHAARVSAESARPHSAAEDTAVTMLANRIIEDKARVASVDDDIESLLADSREYHVLLTIPGVGPKTASALVAGIDIDMFENHNKLASFTGLAPSNKQSGTSLDSAASSRSGNKELKNLLIFSCNSLIKSKGEFGSYYSACRERGMRHNKALKAVARKRLKVIFAVMRDVRPYVQA